VGDRVEVGQSRETGCEGYLTRPYPVTHLLNGSGYFRAKPFPVWYPNISVT